MVIDKPTPLNYILNLPTRDRKRATFHRNSLKPFVQSINYVRVMCVSENEEESEIVKPAGIEPSNKPLFQVEHLEPEQQKQMLKLLRRFPDVLRAEPGRDLLEAICSSRSQGESSQTRSGRVA